jgi:hypothetical protein
MDWQQGTWEPGDRLRYHKEQGEKEYQEVFAGLYWYSGFGSGTFFRPDGTMLQNCIPQEAAKEARLVGVELRFIDSFVTGSFISVMG